MRRAHRLKDNRGQKFPCRLIFLDTETKELKSKDQNVVFHELILGWACYVRLGQKIGRIEKEWHYFEKETDFCSWLENHLKDRTRLYLIAHNIVFDITMVKLFRWIKRRKFQIKRFYDNNRNVVIDIKTDKGTLVLLDNMNFFRGSLEKLGEAIGYAKQKIDFAKCSRKELSIYCRRDVEVMIKGFLSYISFLKKENLGSFGATIPSQAFHAYRHRFMPENIFLHNREAVLKLERAGYYGGRTEAFFIGQVPTENIYLLDVNSMYPYMMSQFSYPVKLLRSKRNYTLDDLKRLIQDHLLMARVKVRTDKPSFPFRDKHKLIFPTGTFWTVLCTPELELALETDAILELEHMALYSGANIFSDYAGYFYQQRKNYQKTKDSSGEYFCKLMLNSLYGKFGQLGTTWKKIGSCEIDRLEVQEVWSEPRQALYLWYFFLGTVWEVKRGKESHDSFPAISAHVTSYARRYLWALIEKAGRENVYYCDTDSLFVNHNGYENLKEDCQENILGKLGLRHEAKEMWIYGAKDYLLEGTLVAKGIKNNAIQIAQNTFSQEQWSTFKTLLYKGDLDNYAVYKITKALKRNYDKGLVTESGWVIPHTLPFPEKDVVRISKKNFDISGKEESQIMGLAGGATSQNDFYNPADLFAYIRARGGIKPPPKGAGSLSGEYRDDIPLTLKNKEGEFLDILAQELGMSDANLIDAIKAEQRLKWN